MILTEEVSTRVALDYLAEEGFSGMRSNIRMTPETVGRRVSPAPASEAYLHPKEYQRREILEIARLERCFGKPVNTEEWKKWAVFITEMPEYEFYPGTRWVIEEPGYFIEVILEPDALEFVFYGKHARVRYDEAQKVANEWVDRILKGWNDEA